jgi:hypothetical protein
VFVVLFIVVCFNAKLMDFRTITLSVSGSILITVMCSSFIIYVLPRVFKRFFDEKRWTIGKYIIFALLHCLLIGLGNTLYHYYLFELPDDTKSSFIHSCYTGLLIAFSVGIIPATVGYFWIRNQRLHADLQEKEDQNRKLIIRAREDSMSDEKLVTLSGNTKDAITLFPSELLFMESSGNYVHVYYKMNGKVTQKSLRATLWQMEELLCEYPFLVRCHRAFIVNIYQIEKIKGLKIRLKSVNTEIPISKSGKNQIQNNL